MNVLEHAGQLIFVQEDVPALKIEVKRGVSFEEAEDIDIWPDGAVAPEPALLVDGDSYLAVRVRQDAKRHPEMQFIPNSWRNFQTWDEAKATLPALAALEDTRM